MISDTVCRLEIVCVHVWEEFARDDSNVWFNELNLGYNCIQCPSSGLSLVVFSVIDIDPVSFCGSSSQKNNESDATDNNWIV